MKVFIIRPLELVEARRYAKSNTTGSLEELKEAWEKYQEKTSKELPNLEFEYRFGSDVQTTYLNYCCYFSEQDIANLEKEIRSLNKKKEIAGLVIDPILTFGEERQYMNGYISGENLERFFNKFNRYFPIFIYRSGSIGDFYFSPLHMKMEEAFRKRGYDLDPLVAIRVGLIVDFKPMLDCLVDSAFAMNEEKNKSMKVKTLT